MSVLLFVDTNIFLDFYRTRLERNLSILDHIDQHHGQLITTCQVEMEFKKNRLAALRESYEALKTPNWSGLQIPAYLATSEQSSEIDKGKTSLRDTVRDVKKRAERAAKSPTRNDPVYKVAHRLFRSSTALNLTQRSKEWALVYRRALRRFQLGYPPRKDNDTSMGDAVNWEWLIHCTKRGPSDVVIVSRDEDYAVKVGAEVHVRDWLAQEFRERVGKKCSVKVTQRLAEGLKLASIKVSKTEEKAEDDFLKTQWTRAHEPLRKEVFEKVFKALDELPVSKRTGKPRFELLPWINSPTEEDD